MNYQLTRHLKTCMYISILVDCFYFVITTKLSSYRTLSSPGRYTDLTWIKDVHTQSLCSKIGKMSSVALLVHPSRTQTSEILWITLEIHDLEHSEGGVYASFKWNLCSDRVKTKSGMPKACCNKKILDQVPKTDYILSVLMFELSSRWKKSWKAGSGLGFC